MPFYRNDGGTVVGGFHISSRAYTLIEKDKDKYALPVDGWDWYKTIEDAYTALGINPPIPEPPENVEKGYVHPADGGWYYLKTRKAGEGEFKKTVEAG